MNKIGILTFHYSNNYGGVLQAYALQTAIRNLGYDIEIVDFVPKSYNPSVLHRSIGIQKNILKNNPIVITKKFFIVAKNGKVITNKFDQFRDRYMELSKRVDEDQIEQVCTNYEVLIVGSDQVWNPSQRKSPYYFLDFNSYSGKKFAYAADSTIEEINGDDYDYLKKCLYDFTSISVRNEHTNNFILNLLNSFSQVVVDPTQLISIDDFPIEEPNISNKYILVYVLGDEINGKHRAVIDNIKSQYGDLLVYAVINPTVSFKDPYYADKAIYTASPQEWLGLIRNASFIYTDSFHGVLFSLKFRVPFLAYYKEKQRATRFLDLKKRFEIGDYIISDANDSGVAIAKSKSIDFDKIEKIVERLKERSYEYLEKILKK